MIIAPLKSILSSRESLRTILSLLVLAVAVCGVALLAVRHEKLQRNALEKQALQNTAPTVQSAFTNIQITGDAAIVYDLANGTVLFSQNSEKQLPLASLTKLLTVYGASEILKNNSRVSITKEALNQDGDSGLSESEIFSFGDLARFTLVASSNDGAEAIAEAARNSRGFDTRQLMTSVASSVGLTRTYALNATGLDVSTTSAGAFGSAHDIAVLSGAVLATTPDIAQATIEPSISIRSENGTRHSLKNTNQDVSHVPGLLLSKTGYTDLAGGNLVIVFDAGIGHPISVVVLGSTKEARFTDVEKLIRATISQFAGLPAI